MQSGTYQVEVPPPEHVCPPPEHVCPSVNFQREPFSIYGGNETMHLLMTTYHEDIMTNFSWVHDRSTVFTHFSEQFSKIYTSLFVNRSFHATEQFRYYIVQKNA